MRSVNLFLRDEVRLAQWEEALAAVLPTVWLNYSESLARREKRPEGTPNELTVQDGDSHLVMLERPTTIHEYDPDEVEVLRGIIGEPKQIFAVDYTDERLLFRVLGVLGHREGAGGLVVENEQGTFVMLKDFLAAACGRS